MKNKLLILLLILMIPFISGYASGDKEIISITVGDVEAPVYNVDVSWEAMEFTYQEQINYIWNSVDHTYELDDSTYEWITTSNNINVRNLSTNGIKVNLEYKSIDKDITGTFNLNDMTIDSGVSTIFKLTLDGKLNSNNTDYIKVGTIELKIS